MPPRLENSLDSRWAGVSREFFVSLRLGGTEIIIKRIIDVYVVKSTGACFLPAVRPWGAKNMSFLEPDNNLVTFQKFSESMRQ